MSGARHLGLEPRADVEPDATEKFKESDARLLRTGSLTRTINTARSSWWFIAIATSRTRSAVSSALSPSWRAWAPSFRSASVRQSPRPFTLNIAFTYSGLEKLGVPAEFLDSFSAEFREGMTARKDVLGDTGANDPSHWVPPLGSRDVRIGVLIIPEKAEALDEPRNEAGRLGGVSLTCQLDVSVPSVLSRDVGDRAWSRRRRSSSARCPDLAGRSP